MALTIKNTIEFKSSQGYSYKINIVEEGGTGSPITDMTVAESGFTLKYTGDENNRFEPVVGSSVSIPMYIQNGTHQTFIQEIIDAQEQVFYVIIYIKDVLDTYRPFWRGLVLQDLVKIEDISYPYIFNLQCTDGLGRLADFEYSNSGTAWPSEDTFKDILIRILGDLEIKDLWGASEGFLLNEVNFYETNTFAAFPPFASGAGNSFDMLDVSRVKNETFQKEETDGTITFSDSLDVLRQVLICFGARIRLVPGYLGANNAMFEVVSINNYKDGVDNSATAWKKDGTELAPGAGLTTIKSTTDFSRLAGGVFNHIPALKKVNASYHYKHSDNPGNFLNNSSLFPTLDLYGTVGGGLGQQLVFDGTINYLYTVAVADIEVFYARWEMTLKVGTKYWVGSEGQGVWQAAAGKYYLSSWDITDSGQPQFYNFVTDVIPATGDLYFQLEFDDYYYWGTSNVFTLPGSGTFTWNTLSNAGYPTFELFYLDENGSVGEGVRTATANNNVGAALVGSNTIYDSDTLEIGDAIYTFDIGGIEIYDTSPAWILASQWYTGAGSLYHLEELRARQILAGQRVPREKFDTKVYWNFYNLSDTPTLYGVKFVSPITTNSKIYVPLNITFNANFDETTGTYFEIDTLETDIDEDETFAALVPGSRSRDNDSKQSIKTSDAQIHLLDVLNITETTAALTSGDSDTSVPIAAIGKALLVTGDVVYLVEPYRRYYEAITINADQAAAATTLTIISETWSNDFPVGSVLLFSFGGLKIIPNDITRSIVTKTSDYTALDSDDTIIIDASSRAVTITLPAAPKNKTYNIVCFDSTFTATLNFNSKNFYDSSDNETFNKGDNLTTEYDGTKWIGG